MTKFLLVLVASWASVAAAQVSRAVHGNTVVSDTLPAADLTVGRGFRYVGGQVVNLYGNADAEQHIFVRGKSEGPVDAFCWMQFEHFLPSNSYTYNYQPVRTVDIGGLSFIYDTKAFTDYHVTTTDTGSDGAAIAALLAKHHLALPVRAARVRMFYLPTADRRTELMIIYGEALAANSSTPTSADGMKLDSADAHAASVFVDHVRRDLTISTHAGVPPG
jgi:hypothetical protein